jgi:hypothetical protein
MSKHIKSAEERWKERVAMPPPNPSVFPQDAVALIYKPSRSATTSGKARTREWKLRFEPRSPRYIEPLIGWTRDDDTLAQVELTFPSAEAAVAYARREGLHYVVHGLADLGANVQHSEDMKDSSASSQSAAPRRRLEWIERTLGPEAIRNGVQAGHDPSVRHATLQDVLRDPALSEAEKRDVLRRWDLDAYSMAA